MRLAVKKTVNDFSVKGKEATEATMTASILLRMQVNEYQFGYV